jgi:hypothetical protein
MKGKGMTELLFLVSRSHADILSHLSHEFVGGDVHVLFDRRHGERRHTRYGAGAARARRGRERRLGERRARRATERELRSIGYSIVTLEATEGRSVPPTFTANPAAVREVTDHLRTRFRDHTPVPSWDVRRDGQGFVLLNGEGRAAHRLLFAKEFLDYYGSTGAERIGRVLDEWKLTEQIKLAGPEIILISSYGIRIGDW